MLSTGPRRMSVLMVAAETGSAEAVTAVMKALSTISAGTKIIVSACVVTSFFQNIRPPVFSMFPRFIRFGL